MRALKRTREISAGLDGSLESLLAQFSATTLELNPSLGTSEFARRLTARAAQILGARAAVLAVARDSEWAIAGLSGPAHRWDATIQHRLAAALAEQATVPAVDLRSGSAAMLFGRELAEALGWREAVLARLTGSEGELLGVLCLVDLRVLSEIERQLLDALVGHASVALENVRLFSRIEQSRKQWVEDFDAISDLIVVHDADNRVLRLNRALADLLKVRPTEAIGRDMGKLELLGSSVQAGRCPFCRNPKAAQEEFIFQAADRSYLVSASRIHSGHDDELRTIHVAKDISDRREAERRYRRERDFNKNILNNTQSMILVLDTAGLISYANRRCFEAGYRESDLLGHSLTEMISPARRPVLKEALERALHGAAVDNVEVPVVRGNGTAGQFSISLSPMRDEQGDINSIVVVMTDVTDAADLQSKLMHTEKMAALGQLVSGVAHEVNNPLAAIVGFTDLLLENPQIPESAKEELRVILQEAQRTRVIVQNLLSFARQMPAQREPVQVNSVLRQTLKLRAYDFSNHGVELVERYEEDLPVVVGDPHQLQQVFLNILNNAYDAIQETRRPGKIEIATIQRVNELEVLIRDNGPGILQPERIFDPFFTTKEVGKGTGLGLSICYGIVRAHQGEISARNNPDGVGCTFIVRLPVVTQGAEVNVAEAGQ
ncbi:MAG: PAS domain-containing protein [Candidatus Acidiferrales bacterium]